MKFFGLLDKAPAPTRAGNAAPRGQNVEMLHRMECKACPLNHAKCYSPKMAPEGPTEGPTLIYILGTAPDDNADDADKPWVGAEAKLIRRGMPADAFEASRWNNIVRTFPGMDSKLVDTYHKEGHKLSQVKEPNFAMIEACRPSIVRDIEREKPEAIFTFGTPALRWVNGETHPNLWQGRRMPVKIGNHKCWLYPFQHPRDIIKTRKWDGFEGDHEFAFNLYLKRACDEVMRGLPEPIIDTEADAREGVDCFEGRGGWDELDEIETFLLMEAPKSKVHGFDIETNRKRPYNKGAKVLSFAVSTAKRTIAVALEHPEAGWTKEQRKRLWDILFDYLMLRGFTKAVHSLGFELEWLAVLLDKAIVWGGSWDDTMSQAFCINETQGLLGLENICVQYFGINIKALSNLDRANLEGTPLKQVLPYNGIDAKYHRKVFNVQDRVLEDTGMLNFYYHHTDRPRALTLSSIKGIPFSQKRVWEYRDKFEPIMRDAENEMRALKEVQAFNRGRPADDQFSPSNNNHLAAILKAAGHKLSLTEKGGDMTNVKSLKGIKHPILDPIFRWRKAAKVLSTYIDAVTEDHEDSKIFEDGLAHVIFSHCKVVTSRTSSEEFNVQNWPKRNENADVRRVVIAPRGYVLVSIDYAGIQARNIAMESRDPAFVQSFIDNYDIHKDWTEQLIKLCPRWAPKNIGEKKVFDKARGAIKNQFVFPTFFGARPSPKMLNGLMEKFGESEPTTDHLAQLQEMLFDEFPVVKKWQDSLRQMYEEKGYVEGLSGHRRHAPVEYTQIINAPIQADETIIVEESHIALTKRDPELLTPIMMIHDDLTFLFPENREEELTEICIEEMTKIRFGWIDPVPLEIEVLRGYDWAEMKEIGKFKNNPRGAGYIQISGKH